MATRLRIVMAAMVAAAASTAAAAQTTPSQTPTAPAAPPAKPAPAPAKPAAKPAPNPAEGIPAAVVDDRTVETIIGRQISSPTGEDMGPIVNMFVSGQGQVRAALIDFGGFLGVGSRQVAVDWRALHFAADGKDDKITCTLTKNQIRLAPTYKAGQPLVVLGAPPPPAPEKPAATAPAEKPAAAAETPPASAPSPAGPAAPAPTKPPTTPSQPEK
ncbi:MAG TPA: PRC-barrel domain-containing protein [Hyphomicrobiales bacterium]|nr:PRC-barrel domain-containing protein [Hyphomicrobiales bacterium]